MTDADRHLAMCHAQHLRDALVIMAFCDDGMRFVQEEHARKSFAKLQRIFEAEDEPECDEIEPRGPYEPASYRADMIDAGRGHLLP